MLFFAAGSIPAVITVVSYLSTSATATESHRWFFGPRTPDAATVAHGLASAARHPGERHRRPDCREQKIPSLATGEVEVDR